MTTRASHVSDRVQYRSIWERLLRANDILLVSPKRPDGDSLGSICGLRAALRTVGKEAVLYCPDPAPPTFVGVLPYLHELRGQGSGTRNQTFDAIVIVDAGDLDFAGVREQIPAWKRAGGALIVIDHHVTNTAFGDVNCIVTDAASTTEAIHRLLTENRVPLTTDVATCLMVGLVTDTDGFTNPATSPTALASAASCMATGARIAPVLRAVYQQKPIAALKLWGKAFERLRVHPAWDIATTVLIPEDFQECGEAAERSEGLSNFLQAVLPVRAILVLKDSGDGMIRGSLRTQRSDVDLGRLAEAFGGGGHRKAAGFGIPGRIVQEGERWKVV